MTPDPIRNEAPAQGHKIRRRGAWAVSVGVTLLAVLAVTVAPLDAPNASAATKRRTTTKTKVAEAKPRSTRPATTVAKANPKGTAPTSGVITGARGAVTTRTYAVATRMQTFVDSTRPTAATSASTAKSSRTLDTLIVAPTDSTRQFPLLVFGHGLTGRPSQYEKLLGRIASAGFVVAAPTFPLSNTNAPGGPSIFDEPNQPGDMSFVITQMLTDKQVDPQSVFAGGHSLGAITTVDLIGNPSLVDARVDGAIVISGTANVFGAAKLFQSTPSIPVLFIHGDLDATVPISLGLSTFASARSPKWFMTVLGGNHVFGVDGRTDLAVEIGLLYTNGITAFLSSVPDGPQVVTAALKKVAATNPSRLSLQSVTNGS